MRYDLCGAHDEHSHQSSLLPFLAFELQPLRIRHLSIQHHQHHALFCAALCMYVVNTRGNAEFRGNSPAQDVIVFCFPTLHLSCAVCIFPHQQADTIPETPPHRPGIGLRTIRLGCQSVSAFHCLPLCCGLVSSGHCILLQRRPGHKYRKFSRVPPRGTALRHTPKII